MGMAEEAGIKIGDFFKAAYLTILNQERGPKLAGFIVLLGKETVIELLSQI